MSWDKYREANPLLQEMRDYNTRVMDRMVRLSCGTVSCEGPCEGAGVVPEGSLEEGWEFTQCPQCQGTGRQKPTCLEDLRTLL